ncbi:hypothetical protein C2R22_22065 (plasmid) [Salinigranum rubrum]|uniref:Glycine zipper-like domain-containing protein n=1 Tax=Salinigranum rubrum TaxID=755307 RepID=A0A2I8VQT8_9EURY|nr:hypothetical protein C2R22_22065 [Salinigranum rubrum]
MNRTEEWFESHWRTMSSDDGSQLTAGTGIAVGLGFGVAAGLAFDNLALWLSITLVLGIWIDHRGAE